MDQRPGPSGVVYPIRTRTLDDDSGLDLDPDDPDDPGDPDNDNLDDVEFDLVSVDEDPNYEENPPNWSNHCAIGMKDIPFTK